jgi:hypothetical protein
MRGRKGSATQRLQQLLFGNGEQGVFYVPQPKVDGQQVLFTDAAGTIPVVADGDPVGLMLDLSGNGSNATQSVAARRPIYRTDGVLHWLEFDGVDDFLQHDPSTAIEIPQPLTIWTAFVSKSSAVQVPLVAQYASDLIAITTSSGYVLRMAAPNSSQTGFLTTPLNVHRLYYNEANSSATQNNVQTNTLSIGSDSGGNIFTLGASTGGGVQTEMDFYGVILVKGEHAGGEADNYMMNRAGITL